MSGNGREESRGAGRCPAESVLVVSDPFFAAALFEPIGLRVEETPGLERPRISLLRLSVYACEYLDDRCLEEIRRPDRPAHPAHHFFTPGGELTLGLVRTFLRLPEHDGAAR